jgi:hypothetical protein
LPLDAFHRDKRKKDGLSYECKTCAKVRVKAWRRSNRDRDIATQKVYREKNSKECNKLSKAWKKRNPANQLVTCAKTSTKKRNAKGRGHCPVGINPYWVKDLHKKQDGKCYWTGIRYNWTCGGAYDPYQVSLDRLDPDKGYSPDNVVLTTLMANKLRAELPEHESKLLFIALGPALMERYHPNGIQTPKFTA